MNTKKYKDFCNKKNKKCQHSYIGRVGKNSYTKVCFFKGLCNNKREDPIKAIPKRY